MSTEKKRRIEFGDFQTPDALAVQVCNHLHGLNQRVRMLMRYPPVPFEIYGIDIAEAIRQYETVQAAIKKVDKK